VSVAARRLSRWIAEESATAQSDGEVERISETVTVPFPRNDSPVSLSLSSSMSSTIGAIRYTAFIPAPGRNRGRKPPSYESLSPSSPGVPVNAEVCRFRYDDRFGWILSSLMMYCQQRPSQSSS